MSQLFWSPGVTLDNVKREVVLMAYNHFKKNKSAAARSLDISIRTLETYLEQYEKDDQASKDRHDIQQRRREEQQARQRGLGEAPVTSDHQAYSAQAGVGVRIQPAVETTEKRSVPVPERTEIQEVLPKETAVRRAGRNR